MFPDGRVVFDKPSAECLRKKLLWLRDESVTHCQKQVNGLANACEKAAQAREDRARIDAREGMVPRWWATLIAAGAAVLGAVVGGVAGSVAD